MSALDSNRRPYVLAVDIGSSSVRVLLFDRDAQAVPACAAHAPYELQSAADGTSQVDPDALLDHVAGCIDTALAQCGPAAVQIAAVAVSTMATTLVGLDREGQPLTPLFTYADTRNGDDALALRQQLDERSVHRRTGCLLRTSYWPARLAWLRRTQPQVWRRAAAWVTLGDYLERRFFGRSRISLSAASWTGLLNEQALAWDTGLLGALGVDSDRLAPLVDADEPLRGLDGEFATRWPALHDVPWFPAVGDGAAANIGSGCTDGRRVALTVGTTGAMRVVVPDAPPVPAGLWLYRVNRERGLLGGATSEGGNLYAWLTHTLQLAAPAALEQDLAARPPDGHGLTVLPFIAGERSPGWAGDARATISGLTLATTPLDIVQAGLEAIAYRFALIYRALSATVQDTAQVVASGGALRGSPAWLQIFADVLGQPVVASAEAEASSRGVALLALLALGALPTLDAAPTALGTTYTPNPAYHTIYQAAIARQRDLYSRVLAAG